MLIKRLRHVALIAIAVVSTCALANPDGPQVVSGTATFSQPNANTLNVTNSHNAIINWQSFNIGAGQTTNFIQPSSASAVMNRVLSNNPSNIYGNLNSNGKVFLINQHGLMIGSGARINTAGFYGSSLNITNEDFLKGKLRFEGGGFGGIENHGYIHAGPNGNVVLIAPDIENGGVIEVDNGNVILAAGESITITSLNDASIEFDVQSTDNGIINLGDIIARQGAARLFAGNLKHSGSINATGIVKNADGSISLVAQTSAEISGDIIATGEQGGEIAIEADRIDVTGTASIDASGHHGGGTILIGGDRMGQNPEIRNATSTRVGADASVKADAIETGDGGKVILFATEDIHVHGEVSARGGAVSGDGGFIETSGLESLDITRAPDASAANGEAGEWLIDPNDITIQDTGPDANITPGPDHFSTDDSAILTTTTIETALNGGTSVSVTTQTTGTNLQPGNITVVDPINKSSGAAASLTLRAHNDININADITSTSGVMNIILDADIAAPVGGQINLGTATLDANGGTIDATNETVLINGGTATISSNMTIQTLNLSAGVLDVTGATATVNGGMNWDGISTVSGGGTGSLVIGLGATLDITTDGSHILNAVTLDNQGTTNYASAGNWLFLNAAAVFDNNGQFDFQAINSIVSSDSSGVFNNNTGGQITKNGVGTSSLASGVTYNHDGATVDIQVGSFSLSGGTLTLNTASVLSGGGTFIGDVVNGGGTVQPGGNLATGILTIRGNLTLGSTSELQFEIDETGLVAGTDFDQLIVDGLSVIASLDGTIDVAQLAGPPVDGTYRLIDVTSGGTLANTFAIENLVVGFGPPVYGATFLETSFIAGGIFWNDGGGDGLWNTAANWSGNLVPLIGDNVIIGVFNVTVAAAANADTLSLATGGSVTLTAGSLTIASGAQFDGDLSISGGSLSGNGNIIVDGNFAWTGGTLTGTGLLVTNATSTINQPAGLTLSRDWTNAGTVNWQNGNILINSGRTFINSSIFNADANGIFAFNSGAETFNNQGTLNVNTNTTFGGGGAFDNSGSFVIGAANILTIGTGSGAEAGTWTVGDGAVNINGGGRTLNDGFNLTSTAGTLSLSGGVLDVNTTSPLTLPATLAFDMLAGTLTGSGDLVVDGSFDWTGGVISGSGLLTTTGASTTNQVGGLTLSRDWTNAGTLDWQAGDIQVDSLRTFTNSGTFNANAGAIFTLSSGSETFDNQGVFSLFSNITIGGTGVFVQTAGQINLNDSILTIPTDLAITGGNLSGSGTIVGDVINNGGTIQPGGALAIGSITVTGNLTNSTGGIEIDIQSPATAGVTYDLIAVSGQADFNDTLTLLAVGGYTVVNNDTFSPITFAAFGGSQFGTIVPIGGENISPAYNANDLTIVLDLSGLITWTGAGVDDLWNNPANWDFGVPNIANDATIPNGSGFSVDIASAADANTLALGADATLNLIGGTLTLASSSTLDGLVILNAGGVDITGTTLILNGGLNWTNTSTIAGGTVNLNSAFGVSAGASNGLVGTTLNVFGDTNYAGGNLGLQNGSVVNNSGVFDFAGDVGIVDLGGATSTFNNLDGATIVKSAGVNTSIDSTVNSSNAGSVDVQTGTLDLNLVTLDLVAGDVLSGSGTYIGDVVNNGGTVRPGGQSNVGTLTIVGDFTNNLGTFEVEIDSAVTHDVLAVTNSLGYGNVAGSILDISLLAFIPAVGEMHNVITCVTSCDTTTPFGTVNQPNGATHSITYNANTLNLTVTSVGFLWDGGGVLDNWFDPLNWSLDVLPDANTNVVLANGDNVVFDGGAATIASLTLDIGSSLSLSTGTLTIQDNVVDLSVNGGAVLAVNGGALINNGDASFDGDFSHAGGNATFNGNVTFNAGYSQSGGIETFAGTTSFNGIMTHIGGSAVFNGLTSMPGTVNLTGGTVTFNAVATMSNLNNSWTGGAIAGGATLVLGVSPGDTTLAISGSGTKTLDTITLDMNQNDINMSGNGDLALANGATIDNTGGLSFNQSGSGIITGAGSFINNGGVFNNLAGQTTISVDFINDAASIVNVVNGTLVVDDADVNDQGSYNVANNATLVFAQDRGLNGTLDTAGTVSAGNGVTLTLPANLNNTGSLQLDNAVLDLTNLGGTLTLTGGANLSGTGTVAGDVDNSSGAVIVGGLDTLGNLIIGGTYTQGASSNLVVEVLNNGSTTISDQLTVNGATTLNGGILLVGFTANSLGLVTDDFSPFNFTGGVSGSFAKVLDAGGNVLFIDATGGVFTILGASPASPDSVIDDLIAFAENSEELSYLVASNQSQADAIMEELLKEYDEEPGSLICK